MNVWFVTIGSSDVQLHTVEHWKDWHRDIRRSLDGLQFEPVRLQKDEGEPYRFPGRVLGIAYDRLSEEIQPCLTFPLLDSFTRQLQADAIRIDRIVVLMSDQSEIFVAERAEKRCPFWQDTCELFPILETYFSEQFPEAEVTPLVLKPESIDRGLDDWDAVLTLVRRTFQELEFEPETIYVSHQAGTPAISSAVQFASLAKFGDRVQFLVSNEYRPEQTRTIESSQYLSAIRVQEAKALLARYDYAGIETILKSDLQRPEQKQLRILLKAAIEWNHAEFHNFKNKLKTTAISPSDFPWWRSGYESAYLATIRLKQGNTVEALFHSFRAAEGTIIAWANYQYKAHIQQHPKFGTQIQKSILKELSGFRNALSEPNQKKFDQYGAIGLFGMPVYELLKQAKPHWKQHSSIQVIWETAKDQRNSAFHTIEGLQESEVFAAWGTHNFEDWSNCLLDCLNFISGQAMQSLEAASLIDRVHDEISQLLDHLI